MFSELDNYIQRIQDQHARMGKIIQGLDSAALNWRPLEITSDDDATNSLAVLVAHSCGAEHYWIAEVVGRMPPTRDRKAEFHTQVTQAEELVRLLEATEKETLTILTALTSIQLDDIRVVDQRTVYVRWAILHIIAHNALHLGHMQLTYQLYHQGRSSGSPYWFESLPGHSV